MTVNTLSYRPIYFREVNDKEVEIELNYHFTMPEGVYLEMVAESFRKAISEKISFMVCTTTDEKQDFFTKRMRERFRGDTYKPKELNLFKILQAIHEKSLMQVNHELELFSTEEEKNFEMKMQEVAKTKCHKLQHVDDRIGEVMTIRQVKHLIAVMDSLGRRSNRIKGYYTLT